MKKLRLILGDQLNINHSWFSKADTNVVFCLFEMRQETDYVKHHIQKVTGFSYHLCTSCPRLIHESEVTFRLMVNYSNL